MTQNRSTIDPYHPTSGYYECVDCLHRETSIAHLGACPVCGGPVHNLAVSRE